jgi:putative methionine-R-sulfoxide reductase with GAF domain
MNATPRKWEQNLKDLEREFRGLVQALDLIVALDRQIFQTSFDLDELLNEILKGLRDLTNADYAQILLRRGPSLVIAHSTQPELDKGKEFKLEDCVCGLAVEEQRTISSGNVGHDYPDRYQWVLGRNSENRMVSEIAVPIRTPTQEEIVGVINIESPQPDAFSASDIEMVEKVGLQAGVAIQNARVHEGLSLTLQLAEAIQSKRQEPREGLRRILEQLANFFQKGVVVQFLMYEKASETLVIESSNVSSTEGVRVLVSDSFSGLVIERGTAVRSKDVRAEWPRLFKDTIGDSDTGHEPTQSELAVPITEDNEIIGVLNVESPQKGAFTSHDEYVLSQIAKSAGAWKRLEHQMRRTLALEKMATVGDVAGNVIHVLRNELTPLEDIIKNLQQKYGLSSDEPEITGLRNIKTSVLQRTEELRQQYMRGAQEPLSTNINRLARKVIETVVS